MTPRFRTMAVAACVLLAARPAAARDPSAACAPVTVTEPLRMRTFAERLRDQIDVCATEARRPDAERFCAEHGLSCTEERVRDYVTMRTLFELTRDGGPWRLRWAITNRDPSAKLVWTAWSSSASRLSSAAFSATAECDELSALFAGLARRLGVRKVGLFWPTWNHTIAAWDAAPGVRVLVPTSQIFLSCDATFDRTSFSPAKQRTVFEFPANDVPDGFVVPKELAWFLLEQVSAYAGASLDLLAALRTHRALRLGSSVAPECGGSLAEATRAIRARSPSPADRRALVQYGLELGLPSPSAEAALDALARAP